jgi:2-polyprenyl-3-methyl-5-hydroxy-6-metoxy-1,4-benzoquinol methylase
MPTPARLDSARIECIVVEMNLAYRIMYALGFTPWDHGQVPQELEQLVERIPPGRALDVGCGTGTQAVWLAQRGFDVVGIDVVSKPIEQARQRARQAAVSVGFRVGDASTSLDGIEGPFSLILDSGCFHSVPARTRDGLTRTYKTVTSPGASLVLFAMGARRGPGPKGLGRDELERRFSADWEIAEAVPDRSTPLPRLLRRATPMWYRLVRT